MPSSELVLLDSLQRDMRVLQLKSWISLLDLASLNKERESVWVWIGKLKDSAFYILCSQNLAGLGREYISLLKMK